MKFAEIDHKTIIAKMADAGKVESKITRRVKNLIREEKTIKKLLYLLAN
jgi:hypothetical protein